MSGSSNEPLDWQAGRAAARAGREVVAGQLVAELRGRDSTGGRAMLARRVRELVVAERGRDEAVLRAAIIEVSLAAAQWAVSVDLKQHRRERGR